MKYIGRSTSSFFSTINKYKQAKKKINNNKKKNFSGRCLMISHLLMENFDISLFNPSLQIVKNVELTRSPFHLNGENAAFSKGRWYL